MSLLPLTFIWLDKCIGNLSDGNEKMKEKFRKILSPLRQFNRPISCIDCIEQSLKDQRIIFLTSHVFSDELFLKKIASLSNVYRIYIYDQQGNDYRINDGNLHKKNHDPCDGRD